MSRHYWSLTNNIFQLRIALSEPNDEVMATQRSSTGVTAVGIIIFFRFFLQSHITLLCSLNTQAC